MAITLKELTKGYNFASLPSSHRDNLEVLHERINKIRTAWAKPMSVTSGYRSLEHHLRVYKDIAAAKGQPFDKDRVPMGSKHLIGAAVDIYDHDGSLHDWCMANVPLLESVGLWCEVKDKQPRVHFQILPPRSGSRFFKP
jgi:uncharacterized protein YcbK (DUF882 family)